MIWDYLIVGAGFAGSVLAERLSTRLGAACLVVDRRRHVAGNAFDACDEAGILLHWYGPHYFRTGDPRVVQYLSQFTDWRPADYKVLSWTDGRYFSFPPNLTTFEQLTGRAATEEEFRAWLARERVPIARPANSEEAVLAQAGRRLYEKFYEGYTLKQWGRHPREIEASVCARVPLRTTRDERYFQDPFQQLPANGYTALVSRMLSASPRIRLLLGSEYREVARAVRYRHLIFTGAIDEYYDFSEGPLPYRSLRFERETLDRDFFQPAVQVNYPNEHAFTRIVEYKHLTPRPHSWTTIVREYPQTWFAGRERYYPVLNTTSQARYARYARRAAGDPRVTFVGRLGRFLYCNMDQVVAMALETFERLAATRETTDAASLRQSA